MRWRWGWLILVLFMPLLSGCWSNRPVELRSMVLALGFTPAPHDRLRVTVQIPTKAGLTSLTGSGSTGGGSGALDYILSAEGTSPGTALTRIQAQMQTDLYLGQVQLVVLSSHLSGPRLLLVEDYLTRLGPMDKTAFAVATPSVRQFLTTKTSTQDLPVLNLIGGFGCTNCETTTFQQHQWDVEMALPTPGDSLWMPYVTLTPTGFNTGRMIAYRGLTPVWALPEKQTVLMGYILGRTGKGYLSFHVGGYTIDIRTVDASPHLSARVVGGTLHLFAQLPVTGTLDAWTGPALTPARVQWIEQQVDTALAPQILAVLERLQREGSVPGGWLAPFIWRSEPSWKPASVWEAHYRQAHITVAVQFHFTNVGDSN